MWATHVDLFYYGANICQADIWIDVHLFYYGANICQADIWIDVPLSYYAVLCNIWSFICKYSRRLAEV